MKTICSQRTQSVSEEIGEGTVPGVFHLCNILEFIIYRLHQGSFPEDNLVKHWHQNVLHVTLDLGYQLYAIQEKEVKKPLVDISFVAT